MPREQILFTFDVKTAEGIVITDLPSSLPLRPVWMNDFRSIPDEEIHVHRDVWMAGVPSVAGESSPYSYAMVNGISNPNQYQAQPEFELLQDRIEEWIIH